MTVESSPQPQNLALSPQAVLPGPQLAVILAAIFVASAGLMLALNWHLRFDLADDAYIHLRIANNMIETGHPYFNFGEPVMVTSSPLWTILLVLNELLFGSRNTLWMWNALIVALAASASYSVAWAHVFSLGWRQKLTALVLPITILVILNNSYLGMETPFAMLLLLLATLAFLRSSSWALPLLALAALTRYELGVPFALVGLVCLWKRQALRYGAVPAATILAIFSAWLLKEFHTIFPSAIRAKSRVYSLTASDSLNSLLPHPLFLGDFRMGFLVLTLLLISFWLIEPMRHSERCEPVQIAALASISWGILLGLIYVVGKTFIFPWYVALVWGPVLVGLFLMTIVDHSKPRRMLALVLAFTFFLDFLYMFPVRDAEASLSDRSPGFPALNESRRVHVYLAVGALLHNVCPNSELLTSEIGGLGYGFKGSIADGVGIASPDAVKYHPMLIPQARSRPDLGAIPPQFVWDRNPDLIVTYDIYGGAVTASPKIQRAYQDLRFYPILLSETRENMPPPWDMKILHVLVKRDGGCPADMVSDRLATVLAPVKPPNPKP
jgi:hypothetical protein